MDTTGVIAAAWIAWRALGITSALNTGVRGGLSAARSRTATLSEEAQLRQTPRPGSRKAKLANWLAFLFNTAEARTTAEPRRVFKNALSDGWEHPKLNS